jgi:hypothetical protein
MDSVKTEYNRIPQPGMSRQEMRKEIDILKTALRDQMSMYATCRDLLDKAEKDIKLYVSIITIQTMIFILGAITIGTVIFN